MSYYNAESTKGMKITITKKKIVLWKQFYMLVNT